MGDGHGVWARLSASAFRLRPGRALHGGAKVATRDVMARAINRPAFADVAHIPAWRRELAGAVKAPAPVFWGVSKA